MRETILTNIGRRSAILHVTVSLRGDVTRNTDGCTTVGDTVREGADVASFMLASETKLIVLAVHGDVVHMLLGELLNGILDSLNATLLAHGLGRIVRVAPGTVPVTRLEWLGVE